MAQVSENTFGSCACDGVCDCESVRSDVTFSIFKIGVKSFWFCLIPLFWICSRSSNSYCLCTDFECSENNVIVKLRRYFTDSHPLFKCYWYIEGVRRSENELFNKMYVKHLKPSSIFILSYKKHFLEMNSRSSNNRPLWKKIFKVAPCQVRMYTSDLKLFFFCLLRWLEIVFNSL